MPRLACWQVLINRDCGISHGEARPSVQYPPPPPNAKFGQMVGKHNRILDIKIVCSSHIRR